MPKTLFLLVCMFLFFPSLTGADSTKPSFLKTTITSRSDSSNPVGSLMVWHSKRNPPSGWLECNGQSFARTDYPDLYLYLNRANAVPDLRENFLRAGDASLLGEKRTDAIASHTLRINAQGINTTPSDTASSMSSLTANFSDGSVHGVIGAHEGFYEGASETVPKHSYTRYFIRAR